MPARSDGTLVDAPDPAAVVRSLLWLLLPPLAVFLLAFTFLPDVLFLTGIFSIGWWLVWLVRRPRHARGHWTIQLFPDPPRSPGEEASRALADLDLERQWGRTSSEEYERRKREIIERFMKE